MKFTKMHGCGNDYIYINCFEETVPDPVQTAITLSDRRFGIGGDGVILICPSEVADCRMDMYNLDGSRGKMCGNGIRCVGKYAYDHHIVDKTLITVETLSGIKTLTLTPHADNPALIETVTVNMGRPITVCSEVPVDTGKLGEGSDNRLRRLSIDGDSRYFTFVSMGNPHAITYVKDTVDFIPELLPATACGKTADLFTAKSSEGITTTAKTLEAIGPQYESHEAFPEKANIEFVHVTDRSHIDFRVWERGSGETFACGTGACASAYACMINGLTDNEVEVRMRGGSVNIGYDAEEDTIYMTGPATEVFNGTID